MSVRPKTLRGRKKRKKEKIKIIVKRFALHANTIKKDHCKAFGVSYKRKKSIFHHSKRVFIEANKKNFFERWVSQFNYILLFHFYVIFRHSESDRSQMFFKIGVIKHFANFIGKPLCWSVFFIELKACSFIKKRLQHRPNILQKSCGVHTGRFLKYVWPFYNIMHERVNRTNPVTVSGYCELWTCVFSKGKRKKQQKSSCIFCKCFT